MSSPSVNSIFIAPSQGEPMIAVSAADAVEEKGLMGDRYYLGLGYYSGDKVWDANVTLIELEAYEAASEVNGPGFASDCLRRNIVTQNVELKSLLGHDFRIGSAVFRGTKPWPPCKYIDALNEGRDVLRRFAQSAGIGATVVTSGSFSVDDEIEDLGESHRS